MPLRSVKIGAGVSSRVRHRSRAPGRAIRTNRVLNVLMPEVGLQGPRIDAPVRQGEAGRMAKHVRMNLNFQPGVVPGPLDHAAEARDSERRAAHRDEDERVFRRLTSQSAQCPQFLTIQGVRGRRSILDAADVKNALIEVHLIPTKIGQFRGAQPVPVCEQDHRRVAGAFPILACRRHEALDLVLDQVLARPQFLVRPAARRGDCAFFGGWRDQLQVGGHAGFVAVPSDEKTDIVKSRNRGSHPPRRAL
jgi:hypothetical protein